MDVCRRSGIVQRVQLLQENIGLQTVARLQPPRIEHEPPTAIRAPRPRDADLFPAQSPSLLTNN